MPYPFLFPVYFIANFAFRLFKIIYMHFIFGVMCGLVSLGIGLFITFNISCTELSRNILPILLAIYSLGWLAYLIWISALAAWNDGFDFEFPKDH